MWIYEKKLQYPVNICSPDVRMAKLLMAQYGGPDSELSGYKPHKCGTSQRISVRLGLAGMSSIK